MAKLTAALSARCSWWATISLHQHRALDRGIEENVANAILIKLNQIGSLTERCSASRTRAPTATAP